MSSMGSSDWVALGSGITTGASTFLSSFNAQQVANTSALNQSLQAGLASSQASAAANTATANAALTESQAKVAAIQSETKIADVDKQRSMLTRLYKNTQAAATATFAAGNVDISTGSALDSLTGNEVRYASDMAQNSYAKALIEYEGNVNQTGYDMQSNIYKINAKYSQDMSGYYNSLSDYYSSTIKGMGETVLTSGLSALGSGLSNGYSTYAKLK